MVGVVGSSVVQHQIKGIMSGARMPRISELDFFNLDFPLPDTATQAEIATAYAEGEEEVTQLRAAAGEFEADARAKFEAAIFATA